MISSTSTTSTSVVMLISDCRLDPESSLLSCMTSFSLRASALGDQPCSPESRLLDCEHRLSDFAKVEFCVAPDHHPRVRLGTYRDAEGFAEVFGCNLLIVDPHLAGSVDGNQDSASLVALLCRLRCVRQVDVRSLPHLRRHHHKD